MSRDLVTFLKQNGIKHQLTVPYSAAQNGVAERQNRSLVEMTRCMLFDAGLALKFGGEALMTAAYLQNRLPTKANAKTPYELWSNRKPYLNHIREFGCRAFAFVHAPNRKNLESKAEEVIVLVMTSEVKDAKFA